LDKYNKPISAYAILTGSATKLRVCEYATHFLDTRLTYCYNVYQIAGQDEKELLASDNPFAKIALIARSVLKKRKEEGNDAALMQIKLNLLREFIKMKMPEEKIRSILKFLVTYMRFENSENEIIFEHQFEQLTGKEQTMGIAELFLDTERKIGRQEGRQESIKNAVLNMFKKNFPDDLIAEIAGVSIEYVRNLRLSVK
jgi:hypothetical protein